MANAEKYSTRLAVERAAVEPFLQHTRVPELDTVILDPPRTGATPEALAGIINWGAPRVIYVSCDPPTLARDAGKLVQSGYELAEVSAFDLFPNTPHVETVATFSRGRRTP